MTPPAAVKLPAGIDLFSAAVFIRDGVQICVEVELSQAKCAKVSASVVSCDE